MSYDDDRGGSRAVALRPKQVTETDIEPLSAAEIVLLQGDLSILTAAQRVEYYGKVCESVGLNPFTKPFDYIVLNGKLTLYAKKDATDQLRAIHGISVFKLEREQTSDSYDVTAYGRARDGREDSSLGSVPITNLKGEALSNAKMKAETKAKRRLTLSLAGLGWLDEIEVAAIPTAQPIVVTETGEIEQPASAPASLATLVREQLSDEVVAEARAVLEEEAAREAPGDDPEPAAATSTAPDAPGAPEGTETAPEAQGEAAEPVDLVAAAKEVFADDLAPGLTMEEMKRMMREKHILSGQVTAIAKKRLNYDGMVADMTDADRYRLWEAILDDSKS